MDATAARLIDGPLVDQIKPLADLLHRALRVERLTLRHRPAWDRYVIAHADGTFFHLSGWMESVQGVFAHQPHYLMARRGERIAGVLPLFLVRSRLGGAMLVSVPYAVAGGMLVDDDAARDLLWSAALRLADDVDATVIDLRCERDDLDLLPIGRGPDASRPHGRGAAAWRGSNVDGYVKFVRQLPDAGEDVLGFLPRKARAAARNGEQKYGLIAEFGRQHLRIVWRLYCRSMRRLGSISYPFAFFEQLVERFSRDAYVQIVRRGEEVVGGLVSFRHGDTFLPYFAGCDERFNHWQTNNVLYLAAMRRAVEVGCRAFDFGRTRVDNRGSYDFKRFHGFEPRPLAYQRWVRDGTAAPNLTPSNAKFRLGRRIWPLLPQAVCVRLSGILAPHIPG
jgi:FemAB-related protein (PEP-CTERM system-associated)